MEKKEIFDLIIQTGEVMLVNGGEIYRVRDIMRRMAENYGIDNFSSFVIANGIFASASIENKSYSAQVRTSPLSSVHLGRVSAVNDLSREISCKQLTPEETQKAIDAIKNMPATRPLWQILAGGMGSCAFCYIFGGSLWDSAVASLPGMLICAYFIYAEKHSLLSKIMINILGSAFVTLVSCLLFSMGLGNNLDKIIIGSIIPMVPGVPITNAIRNFFDNDYLSGIIRAVDAVLVAVCIATGVGIITKLWDMIFVGGIL